PRGCRPPCTAQPGGSPPRIDERSTRRHSVALLFCPRECAADFRDEAPEATLVVADGLLWILRRQRISAVVSRVEDETMGVEAMEPPFDGQELPRPTFLDVHHRDLPEPSPWEGVNRDPLPLLVRDRRLDDPL